MAGAQLVLELRVFDDLSFKEVAELADCTENTAKVNFHYAVKRLRELLGSGEADMVVCDVGPLTQPDAVTVDALARLQLIARRLGSEIRLRHACGELRELIAFIGLDDVVPLFFAHTAFKSYPAALLDRSQVDPLEGGNQNLASPILAEAVGGGTSGARP